MPPRAGIVRLDLLRLGLGADSFQSARKVLLELRGLLFSRPPLVALNSNFALQPSRCAIGFVVLWTFACGFLSSICLILFFRLVVNLTSRVSLELGEVRGR